MNDKIELLLYILVPSTICLFILMWLTQPIKPELLPNLPTAKDVTKEKNKDKPTPKELKQGIINTFPLYLEIIEPYLEWGIKELRRGYNFEFKGYELFKWFEAGKFTDSLDRKFTDDLLRLMYRNDGISNELLKKFFKAKGYKVVISQRRDVTISLPKH